MKSTLNLIHVDPPSAESLTGPSDNCPGHWLNVVVYGKCEMHNKKIAPEVEINSDVMPF